MTATAASEEPQLQRGVRLAASLEAEWAGQVSPILPVGDSQFPNKRANTKKRPNPDPQTGRERPTNPRGSTSDFHHGEDSGLEASARGPDAHGDHPAELVRFAVGCLKMAEEHYDDYIETVDRRGRELVRTLRELHDYGSGYMIDIRDNVRNIEETEAGAQRARNVWRHGMEKHEAMLRRGTNLQKEAEGDIRDWTKRAKDYEKAQDLREARAQLEQRLKEIEEAYRAMEEEPLEVKVEEQDVKPFGDGGLPNDNDENGD